MPNNSTKKRDEAIEHQLCCRLDKLMTTEMMRLRRDYNIDAATACAILTRALASCSAGCAVASFVGSCDNEQLTAFTWRITKKTLAVCDAEMQAIAAEISNN